METTIYHDRPPEFWSRMGPFFASRAVRKEMPYLSDGPGYIWFVVHDEDHVRAFASVDVDAKGIGHLRNAYVLPGWRGNHAASHLMEERLRYLREKGVTRARTTRRIGKENPFAERHGFRAVGKSGGYEVLEIDLEQDEEAQRAGYNAAKAKLATMKGRRRVQTIRPSQADRAAYAGRWEAFTAGWIQACREYREEIATP